MVLLAGHADLFWSGFVAVELALARRVRRGVDVIAERGRGGGLQSHLCMRAGAAGRPRAGGWGGVTESQNHRMVRVGRDLCGSPSPTSCRSRVTHSRLHRTLSRRILNISREGDSTASLGSLGQGSVTLRGKRGCRDTLSVPAARRCPPSPFGPVGACAIPAELQEAMMRWRDAGALTVWSRAGLAA